MDSHYEPLLIAYKAIRGGDEEPSVEEPTKRGVVLSLEPELRAKMTTTRSKYLYVYET
jgi:hypothetical protein